MKPQQRQSQTCAQLFAEGLNAKQIARALHVTERTVYRIIKTDAFHTELDALGYDGIRKFQRKVSRRGKSQKYDKARILWEKMQRDGTPKKSKQAGVISEKLNTPVQTVRGWIREWSKE